MRARHLGLFLIAAGLLLSSLPAHAAAPLAFSDPAGDALDSQKSMDIVGVGYSVGKTSTGKPQFVIKLTLDAPPSLRLSAYTVEGRVSPDAKCDEFEVDFRPGRALERLGTSPFELWVDDCTTGDIQLSSPKGEVKGNTITWFVPFDSLKKKALAVGKVNKIQAYTGTVDPVFGLEGNAAIEGDKLLPTDEAVTTKEFVYA